MIFTFTLPFYETFSIYFPLKKYSFVNSSFGFLLNYYSMRTEIFVPNCEISTRKRIISVYFDAKMNKTNNDYSDAY